MTDVPQERSLQDRSYDMLGELIADREAEKLLQVLGETTPEEDAEIQAFFAKYEKKHLRQIRAYFRKKNRQRFVTHTLPAIGKIAAIAILCIAIATGAAIALSDSFRATVMRLLIIVEKEYTRLEVVEEEVEPLEVPEGWGGMYFPSYAPGTLKVGKIESNPRDSYVAYVDCVSGEIIFKFSEYRVGGVTHLDTENAVVKNIVIQGRQGLVVMKGDWVDVYWYNEHSCFLLTVKHQTEETVMHIVESMRKIL